MDIKSLPENVRENIRSGVIITTISQCVNELVLNSLDADSTAIAIRINHDKFRIEVVDNGNGITKNNLQQIGVRYMTNKCHDLKDFERNLKFYGFRGEALASIRNNCKKLIISTRCSTESETLTKTIEGNDKCVQKVTVHRPSKGTTVRVENFLYNLPVRKNRSPDLDFDEIRKNLECLSIIKPGVIFSLRNDTNMRMIFKNSHAETVEKALINSFPEIDKYYLRQIKVSRSKTSVTALIYKKLFTSNKCQFIYANKRPFNDSDLHKHITEILLQSSIQAGSKDANFAYVLNIKCPYSQIEISASSGKYLVQFKNFDLILKCVSKVFTKFLEKENLTVEKKEEAVVPKKKPRSQIHLSDIEGVCKSKQMKRDVPQDEANVAVGQRSFGFHTFEFPKRVSSKGTKRTTIPKKVLEKKIEFSKKDFMSDPIKRKRNYKDMVNDKTSTNNPEITSNFQVINHEKADLEVHDTIDDMVKAYSNSKLPSESILKTNTLQNSKSIPKVLSAMPKSSKTLSKSKIEPRNECIEYSSINDEHFGKTLILSKFLKACEEAAYLEEEEKINENTVSVSVKIKRRKTKVTEENDDFNLTLGMTMLSKCVQTTQINNQTLHSQILDDGTKTVPSRRTRQMETKSVQIDFAGELENVGNSIVNKVWNVLHLGTAEFLTNRYRFDEHHNESEICLKNFSDLGLQGDTDFKRLQLQERSCRTFDSHKFYNKFTHSHHDSKIIQAHQAQDDLLPMIPFRENAIVNTDVFRNDEKYAPEILEHDREIKNLFSDKKTEQSFHRNQSHKPSFDIENYKPISGLSSEVPGYLDILPVHENYRMFHLNCRKPSNYNEFCNDISTLGEKNYHARSPNYGYFGDPAPLIKKPKVNIISDIVIKPKREVKKKPKRKLRKYYDLRASRKIDNTAMFSKRKYHYPRSSEVQKIQEQFRTINNNDAERIPMINAAKKQLYMKYKTDPIIANTSSDPRRIKSDSFNTINFNTPNALIVQRYDDLCAEHVDKVLSISDDFGTVSRNIICTSPYKVPLDHFVKLVSESTSPHTKVAECDGSSSIINATNTSSINIQMDAELKTSPFFVPKESTSVQCLPSPQIDLKIVENDNNPEVDEKMIFYDPKTDSKQFVAAPFSGFVTTKNRNVFESADADYNFLEFQPTPVESVVWGKPKFPKIDKLALIKSFDGEVSAAEIGEDQIGGDKTNITGLDVIMQDFVNTSNDSIFKLHSDNYEPIFEEDEALKNIDLRTGMTVGSMDNTAFNMTKRISSMPKGYSQKLSKIKIPDLPLSASTKLTLYNALAKSYERELDTIKWKHFIVNNEPRKFFDAIYSKRCRAIDNYLDITKHKSGRLVAKTFDILNGCSFSRDVFNDIYVIGQLDKKFIVSLAKNRTLILLFDQHAVHERIRVEQLFKDYVIKTNDSTTFKTECLTDEIVIKFSNDDISLISAFSGTFETLGFKFVTTSNSTKINNVPMCLHKKIIKLNDEKKSKKMIKNVMDEVLAMIRETKGIICGVPSTIQNVINSEACRGAIMFGDELSKQESEKLIHDLSKCNLPFQCAHGRPTLAPIIELINTNNKNRPINFKALKKRNNAA